MKLAKYLADYIEHETVDLTMEEAADIVLEKLIQQGIEAFASTEDVELTPKDFAEGWKHFCNCMDFNQSFLDTDAIRFMNKVPGKIMQILERLQ